MWLLTAVMALVGGFVRGFSGFGGPAVMSMVLTLFYSPASVLPKILLVDTVAQVKLIPNAFPDVDWKFGGAVIGASLAGMPLGAYLLVVVEPEVVRRVLAGAVAVSTLCLLAGVRFKTMPGLGLRLLAGFVAGVVLGATYIALIAVVFFLATPMRAVAARAGVIIWAFATGVVLIGVYAWLGQIALGDVWRSFLVGLVYLVGVMLGIRVFKLVGERDFRRAVMWLLVVLSVGVMLA